MARAVRRTRAYMTRFDDLGLSEHLLAAVSEMGFEEPTPIQTRAIPPLLKGRDVVAQALTGTGKTAAFGVPLVQLVDVARAKPQAIVLVPTRELALQVAEELMRLGRPRGLRLLPIYGGQPMGRQLAALRRGVHAIVATPGRLMDHMRRGSVDLSGIRMLVLDEADRMLDMGFQEDVELIIAGVPKDRVTALFSATIPKPILDIVHRYMRDPETIRLSKPREMTAPATEQTYFEVPFPRKFDALARLLDVRRPDRAIVFCSTKRMTDEVAERLQARGYSTKAIHGDISQPERESVLRAFREGAIELLIATDVAARGLDIPEVSLVVNFDIPPDPEYYVHRIGRTGRLGRKGEAVTFVNPREMHELRFIERATGAQIRRGEIPTQAEADVRGAEVLEERVVAMLAKDAWRPYRAVVDELSEDHDPLDVAAAALALIAAPRATKPTPRMDGDGRERPRSSDGRPASRPTGARQGAKPPTRRTAPRRRTDRTR